MGYLQALRLMVKAYKAAKGTMPKGIDLLKMKMRARQKAIDSTKGKVIQFPPERITNPFKARPQPPKIEMKDGIQTTRGLGDLFKRQLDKVTERVRRTMKEETDAQTIARMKKQNKDSVARLKEKKDLGDILKDLPDDIPDMADGGVASAIKKIKRRFGKKSITTGDKIKRPGNRQLFDDFKRRNKFNVGGMANLSQTYDNNPTLQAQFPNKQDYLDLFSSQTTTTTPTTEELATGITTQATQPAAINPIKPIIPISESGDGGGPPPPGGGITRGISLDYGYTSPGGIFNLDDIAEGTVADEDYTLGMRTKDAVSGIMSSPFVRYNPMNPMFIFNVGKAGVEKAKEFAEQVQAQKALEAEQARQAQMNAARAALAYQTQTGEGSGYTGGFDPSTQNYDDPFDPGQTE